uniref:Uncharacterized protein n=1 Tax=Arundo donax TaxID=35708 RepID=A0A0A8YTP6_ARUDO
MIVLWYSMHLVVHLVSQKCERHWLPV